MPNKFLYFLCIFTLTLATACSPKAKDFEQVSKDSKIIIRFSHVVGEDTPKGQAARLFAKLMKERTNGHVEVQIFSNGSLYKDSEELKALQKGYVQMIAPAISKLNDLVPEIGVFDLPYLFPQISDYHKVFDGKTGKQLALSFEKKNMISLGFWDNGFKQFTNNVRPIRNPQNMAGLTMRIMSSPVLEQQFKELYGSPVDMNFNDVYHAFEEGSITGQENTVSNIYTKQFYRVQKYMTISNHGYLGYAVLIDKKFWNTLPADIQKTIRQTMDEVTQWQRQQAVIIENKQLQEIYRCDCIEIVKLNEKEIASWKEFYKPLYQIMGNQLEFITEN